ncbi:MAG TPA: hypothetical protein DCE33_10985, partial [Rhodospirillaceae bacterium]|nr:hypothetical protein [Rhodospirillaceae bacterium]
MPSLKNLIIAGACLSAIGTAAIATPGQAAFPERTVTFYIMHKPGGGTDTTFRAFLPYFEKHLGGKVAAVNKTGGGGAKMLNFLARSKPDGYTIGSTNLPNFPVSLILRKGLHFTIDSFDQIGAVNLDPTAIYVRADSKYKDFKQVVADAKKNPGKVTLGFPNYRNHGLTILRIQEALGIKFNLVPFGGGGPTRKAVLGKHVPMGTQSAGANTRFHPKKLRILVQFAPKRTAHAPSVPTITELTGAKVYHTVVRMAGGPKGMPKEVLTKLRSAWKAAMHDPAWLKQAKKLKLPVKYISGEEAQKMSHQMYKDLKKLFDETPGLKKLAKKKKKKK